MRQFPYSQTHTEMQYTQKQMDALRSIQKTMGSFHSTLIECWFLADNDNKLKLEEAFPFLLGFLRAAEAIDRHNQEALLSRTSGTRQYEVRTHKGKTYMQGKKIFDR